MGELKFRKLNAGEIEVRIGAIRESGVQLLLYKDARCDQAILDEEVGPMNWQRTHSRDNANCTVSIYDEGKKMWVAKEDTGKESYSEKEKGLASDSFKRACFNWGIGRALYSANKLNLFFFAKELGEKYFRWDSSKEKGACYCSFVVKEIEYNEAEDVITRIVIDAMYYNTLLCEKTFVRPNVVGTTTNVSQTQPAVKQNAAPIARPQTSQGAQTPAQTSQTVTQPLQAQSTGFAEDEIILIGNCRGKKFGEAKHTPAFESFINWVKGNPGKTYKDPKEADQFRRFAAL